MSVYIGKYNFKTKESIIQEGSLPILIHPGKTNEYSCLSPYQIRNDKGEFVENAYQFRKLYRKVAKQNQWSYVEGMYGKQQTWCYPSEVHVENDMILPEYWVWREKGLNHDFAIRYPNGFNGRSECIGLIPDGTPIRMLPYLQGREIYIDGYRTNNIKQMKEYQKLERLLHEGQSITILEVDGTSEVTPINMETLKEARWCEKRPFGHGWVIGAMLLDFENEI